MAPGQLLGRRRELAALRGWLEAARSGAGRLVLCAGEPGAGKTRIAQELVGHRGSARACGDRLASVDEAIG